MYCPLCPTFIYLFIYLRFIICVYFSDHSDGRDLDSSLVRDLLGVLDEHNKLVKKFRIVRDFRAANENIPVSLRLFRNRTHDARTYNVTEIDEVVAFIVGDFDQSENGRDIVVKERDGSLRRIHETHAKYILLEYPLLFPFGEDQYEEHIELNELTETRTVNKHVRVSVHQFVAFRMQERANEDSIVLYGKRLFQQFAVDMYSMIESQRLSFIRNN